MLASASMVASGQRDGVCSLPAASDRDPLADTLSFVFIFTFTSSRSSYLELPAYEHTLDLAPLPLDLWTASTHDNILNRHDLSSPCISWRCHFPTSKASVLAKHLLLSLQSIRRRWSGCPPLYLHRGSLRSLRNLKKLSNHTSPSKPVSLTRSSPFPSSPCSSLWRLSYRPTTLHKLERTMQRRRSWRLVRASNRESGSSRMAGWRGSWRTRSTSRRWMG